jgi:YesN/AraC family two-component response regulator
MMNTVADQHLPQQDPIIHAQDFEDNNEGQRDTEAAHFRASDSQDVDPSNDVLRIFAIDCCPHVVKALSEAPNAQLISVSSQDNEKLTPAGEKISLIVVGISRFPVRRMFISELRRMYPETPMLLLRKQHLEGAGDKTEEVMGEFLLSSQATERDLETIRSVRALLPIDPCSCMEKPQNSEIVKDAIKVIASQFSDADLNLEKVADQLPVSAAQLSRILNHEVGISFRQLLQQTRIEEAKRMLSTHKYSIKQVAYSVGFSDSHYFSRCFKKVTGYKASEFTERVSSL